MMQDKRDWIPIALSCFAMLISISVGIANHLFAKKRERDAAISNFQFLIRDIQEAFEGLSHDLMEGRHRNTLHAVNSECRRIRRHIRRRCRIKFEAGYGDYIHISKSRIEQNDGRGLWPKIC